jgi:hypothetical protein
LKIPVGDKEYQIYGGSVYTVKAEAFDVVIAFEKSYKGSPMAFPWTPGIEFSYPITDGSAPGNPKNFKKLVFWVADQLVADKKVWCGCIGGHGRTGTFLAALVAHMTDRKDAINYVRENYCTKAVESTSQVTFLTKHFGCDKVDGSKAKGWDFMDAQRAPGSNVVGWPSGGSYSRDNDIPFADEVPLQGKSERPIKAKKPIKTSAVHELIPVPTDLNIHGDNKIVSRG